MGGKSECTRPFAAAAPFLDGKRQCLCVKAFPVLFVYASKWRNITLEAALSRIGERYRDDDNDYRTDVRCVCKHIPGIDQKYV